MTSSATPTLPRARDTMGPQALTILVAKIAAMFAGYLFIMGLARGLSTESFGQVAFFVTSAPLVGAFAGFGYPLAILRLTPRLLASGQEDEAAHLFRRSGRTVIGFATVVAAIHACIMVGLLHLGVFPGFELAAAICGSALIPLWAMSELTSHELRARQRMFLAFLPRDVLWKLAASAVLLGLSAAGFVVGAGAWLGFLCFFLALVTALQFRAIPAPKGSFAEARPSLPDIRPFWLSNTAAMVLSQMDILLVAAMLGAGPAGQYFVANRLAQVLAIFQTAGNQALAPTIASERSKQRGTIAHLTRKNARQVTVPTALSGAILLVFAPFVLGLFGSEHVSSVSILLPLVLAAILNAASGAGDIALLMSDHQKEASRVSSAVLFVAPVVMVPCLFWGGPVGLAWSSLFLTALRKWILWRIAYARFGERIDMFSCLLLARP